MYITPDDTLKTLYERRLLSGAQYRLINKLAGYTANEHKQANLLFAAASDPLRALFMNAVVSAYAAQDLSLVFVQDFRRFQAKGALSFRYDDADYPFLKLSKKIDGRQVIAIDSLYPHPAAMQALTALNHYPLGIVSIEAGSIPAAFQTLYQMQKPFQRIKSKNTALFNAFINNLFDYILLLEENKPLKMYRFQRNERTERISDWSAVLKPV